jgi:hypothetical protein
MDSPIACLERPPGYIVVIHIGIIVARRRWRIVPVRSYGKSAQENKRSRKNQRVDQLRVTSTTPVPQIVADVHDAAVPLKSMKY